MTPRRGNPFVRYELRTTDVDAAGRFYAAVLGPDIWGDDVMVTRLPERAAALGAPAHWLGHIAVADVEASARLMVTLGWQQLGPVQRDTHSPIQVVLRDPFGAVMAVRAANGLTGRASVAWHLHQGEDHERAFALYSGLFAWTTTEVADLGPEFGHHHMFTWGDGGPAVGSMADSARLPHVHPHWLFFFSVPDLNASVASVLDGGGSALDITRTSDGDLVVACEDPQRAAFGLYQFTKKQAVDGHEHRQ